MNLLKQKYLEFAQLHKYQVIYDLADGRSIIVVIERNTFPHLIGLHKLIDIPIIRQFNNPSNLTRSKQNI